MVLAFVAAAGLISSGFNQDPLLPLVLALVGGIVFAAALEQEVVDDAEDAPPEMGMDASAARPTGDYRTMSAEEKRRFRDYDVTI